MRFFNRCLLGSFIAVGLNFAITDVDMAIAATQCRDGWIELPGLGCYHFQVGPVNYHEADRYCQKYNSYLVEIGSQAEQDGLQAVAGILGGDYWTGMTQIGRANSFRWMYSGDSVDYSNWSNNNPNPDVNKEAVIMNGQTNYKWDNVSYQSKANPLCETQNYQL